MNHFDMNGADREREREKVYSKRIFSHNSGLYLNIIPDYSVGKFQMIFLHK